MLTRFRRWVPVAVWLKLMVAAWVLLVTGQISAATWVWLNVGVVAVGLTVIVSLARLMPAPRLAQIPHAAEPQPRS